MTDSDEEMTEVATDEEESVARMARRETLASLLAVGGLGSLGHGQVRGAELSPEVTRSTGDAARTSDSFTDDFDYPTFELDENGWTIETGRFETDGSVLLGEESPDAPRANIYRSQPSATGTFEITGIRNDADFFGISVDFISNATTKSDNSAGYRVAFENDVGGDAGQVAFKRVDPDDTVELATLDNNHYGAAHDVRIERDPDSYEFTIYYDGREVATVADDTYTESTYWTIAYGGSFGSQRIDGVSGPVKRPAVSIDAEVSRPVQVVENSRVTGDSSFEFPTAPVLEGRSTAVIFGVETMDLDALPEGTTVDVSATVKTDGGASIVTDEVTLSREELRQVRDAEPTALPSVFESAGPPPVVDPDGSIDQVDLEVSVDQDTDNGAPVPDVKTEDATLSSGADYETATPDSLTIALGEIKGPEGGEYYGSLNEGRNTADLQNFVEQIEATAPQVLPVRPEDVDVLTPLEQACSGVDEPGEYLTDLATVYDEIEDALPGGRSDFDVAVTIAPVGYLSFHNFSTSTDGIEPINFRVRDASPSEAQPQSAAVIEGPGTQGSLFEDEETNITEEVFNILHEMCHNFTPLEFYPEQISAERRVHARSDIRSTRVEPQGYAVSEGAKPLLSPAGGDVADEFLYDKLVEGFEPRPPEVEMSLEDTGEAVIGLVLSLTESAIEVLGTLTRSGRPSPTDAAGSVEVTTLDGSGDPVDTRTFSRATVAVGSGDSTPRIDDIVYHVVSFPETTAEIRLKDEFTGNSTTLNPITQTLRNTVEAIPDRAFRPWPEGGRTAVRNRLTTIERLMSKENYRAAVSVARGLRRTVEEVLKDGYSTDAQNEPTKAEVINAVDDRVSRLETIAADAENPGHGLGGSPSN